MGSIPLEAQRLGLRAIATDLNPVAVLINKALIEIPTKFAGMPPVNPESHRKAGMRTWKGAEGLAEDVRYYGKWMRDEAIKRIGHLYPPVKVTKEMAKGRPDVEPYVGKELTVIAWLWARTVPCPNPACGLEIPLTKSFAVSTSKSGKTWVIPNLLDGDSRVRLQVASGPGDEPEPTIGGKSASCLRCGNAVPLTYVRDRGRCGEMGAQMMAMVVDGARHREYLAPDGQHEQIAVAAVGDDPPDTALPEKALGFRVQAYGLARHRDLYSKRQLTAFSVFCELVLLAQERVKQDATKIVGEVHAGEYASAIGTYLAFAVDKAGTRNSTQTTWHRDRDSTMNAMSR